MTPPLGHLLLASPAAVNWESCALVHHHLFLQGSHSQDLHQFCLLAVAALVIQGVCLLNLSEASSLVWLLLCPREVIPVEH